uniref:hypothetical protein n=1 Tax=Nocardioides sp. TaxID=35761 RepID=UPI002B27A36C
MSDHDHPGTDLADRTRSDSPRAGSVALTGARSETLQRPRRASSPQDETSARSKPLILPPARLDQELAAEAARVRREVVGARQEDPRVEEPPSEAAPPAAAHDAPVEDEPVEAAQAADHSDDDLAEPPTPEPTPLAGLPTAGVPASQ